MPNIWEISNKLFHPLRKYIGNKKIIFISPDSELNRISFAALRSPKNNKRFINEDYEIRLITTGRELLTLNQNKKSFETSFVIANPDFEHNINKNLINIPKIANISATRSYDLDNAKWSSLPGSKKEVDLIS